ncbi:MAG: alpha-glucuronidase, partial [Oxalobacteraceae bacterium]
MIGLPRSKGLRTRLRGLIVAACLACSGLLAGTGTVHAEDGYALWLRYPPLSTSHKAAVSPHAMGLLVADASPTGIVTRDELVRGLGGMLGVATPLLGKVERDGVIVVGTPASLPSLARFKTALAGLGSDGYLIRETTLDGHAAIVVAANSDVGALYGAYHLLRLLQTGHALTGLH